MLPVPPEILRELGLEEVRPVRITPGKGGFYVEPERRPDPDAAASLRPICWSGGLRLTATERARRLRRGRS